MKKIIVFFTAISLVVASGCKSAGPDPKNVLSLFFDALAKKDFAAVKRYTTQDSEGILQYVQMAMQHIPDSTEMMQYQKENLVIGDAVINGENATVPVMDKKSGETIDFTLKKEDGWKVAVDISTIMQMARKKMEEHGFSERRDSLGGINRHSPLKMDSISREEMQKARKMLDSANKILNQQ